MPLSETELAERAGVTPARVRELVQNRVLERSPDERPFAAADVRKVRLAQACEDAGLPLHAIATAIGKGGLSLAFLDLSVYDILAEHTGETFGDVAAQRRIPLGLLAATREALGFARPHADEPVREDDMRVFTLVELAGQAGLAEDVILQLLRVFGEHLARIAEAEGAVYRRDFVTPFREAGESVGRSMELASEMAGRLIPVLEAMTVAIYHRQQERIWLQNLIETIETVLEEEGLHQRKANPAAMCFLDLAGYTRLTEERGDEAAARLAARLGSVVQTCSVEHGGRPVKWLGDGVMSYFGVPTRGVQAGLAMLEGARQAGLPPARVGLAAGPVVHQDGDYYGRTVNLAARIAARADPGEVLVSESVVAAADAEDDLRFEAVGEVSLKGLARPLPLFRARSSHARAPGP